MGIQGLLKGLQGYSEKSNIRTFSRQSIAVDTSSWLHKSVYSISEKYVESSERSKTVIDSSSVRVATTYVQNRCQELFSTANVGKIYLVFDGKRCPLKAATTDTREDRRKKNLNEARYFRKQGRHEKAEEKYRMCIKIHDVFALAVAEQLKKVFERENRLHFIFSPYEADAQLVRLGLDKVADAVITEDSDVLVYCASCNFSIPIIYKLDRQTGDCDVLSMNWLIHPTNNNRSLTENKKSGALHAILQSFADRQSKRPGLGSRLFVQACVLAGSDYSPSKLHGIGLVTAFKLLRDHSHRPCNDRFRFLLDGLSKKIKGSLNIDEYEKLLAQSEVVFYHHPVLNAKNQLTFLTIPKSNTDADNCQREYYPLLTRFDGDLWFLGDVVELQVQNPKPPSASCSQSTSFPVKEVVLNGAGKKIQAGKIFLSKRRCVEVDSGANEAEQLMNSVKNPYDQTTRQRLEEITNKEGKENPFDAFAHGNVSVNKREGYSFYLSNRCDLRFTKRKFNEKGKPVNPDYRIPTKDIVKPACDTFPKESSCVPAMARDARLADCIALVSNTMQLEPAESLLAPSENVSEHVHNCDTSTLLQDFPCNIMSLRASEETLIDGTKARESPSASKTGRPLKGLHNHVQIAGDSDEDTAFPHHFISDPCNKPHYSHAHDRGKVVVDLEDSAFSEFDISPGACLDESKYFSSNSVNPRRVTLEQRETPLNEFERTGTYVNLALSSGKPNENPFSPGEGSVLSEVDEMVAAAIPRVGSSYRHRDNGIDKRGNRTPSITGSFSRTPGTPASISTPFQNNFNAIQRHNRKRCSSNQLKLHDVWDQTYQARSTEKTPATTFKKKAVNNRITSYYGYQSVVAERIISDGDDEDFLGL